VTLQTPTGSVVAGFRVGAAIGRGAMGAVYLAESEAGRRVALKLLAPELAGDVRFRQRFLREAQLAETLRHPNVVPTVAFGEEDGLLYLAMAYVDGADLRELLRGGALEPERALRLVEQAGEALDAAHAAGLVHRDVKPGNILVAGAGERERAYVCDFGLARHVSSVGSLTGDRGFVGTIDYVAPEQIAGSGVDGRADVYALGCVLYECLAGARPFGRESELAVVFAHLNEPPPRLSDRRPDLPRALDDVFARALAKSPDERYATCGELMAAVRGALAGEAPERRRFRWVATLMSAVAVAAIVAGVLVHDASEPARATPAITQTSIGGARLGLTKPQYKQLFGLPWREDVMSAPGYPVVIFHARKLSVYFDGKTPRGIIVTTWNPAYRTAARVGPCSSLHALKDAYGSRLKPSPQNTQHGTVYGWLVRPNLFFAMNGGAKTRPSKVAAVAIYDGDGPRNDGSGVYGHGGTLAFAGYVALSETPCGS
jgi:tRNA A-37 threonylcarbamoyl transferase component Bud32